MVDAENEEQLMYLMAVENKWSTKKPEFLLLRC